MLILKYIILFFIFSFFGWLYEQIIKKKNISKTNNLPFSFPYGFGLLILLLIQNIFFNYSIR